MTNKKRKIYTTFLCLIVGFTLAFIWGNSCIPKLDSGQVSGSAFVMAKPILDFVFYPIFGQSGTSHLFFRKLAHWAEFFVLGIEIFVLFKIWAILKFQIFFNIISIGTFTAIIDESIQILSHRGPAVVDILLDCFGYITAILIAYCIVLLTRLIKYLKKRKSNKVLVQGVL